LQALTLFQTDAMVKRNDKHKARITHFDKDSSSNGLPDEETILQSGKLV
jgi:hypothetical protein